MKAINPEALVDAFFPRGLTTSQPEIIPPTTSEMFSKETVSELFEKRKDLVKLVHAVFTEIQKALLKNSSAAVLKSGFSKESLDSDACEEAYGGFAKPVFRQKLCSRAFSPLLCEGITAEIASLFNNTIGQCLGLSIHEKVCETKKVSCYFVTWGVKSDIELRNLLGVHTIPSPESYVHQLNVQRMQGNKTDVVFRVEGQLVHAHKAIFAKNQYLSYLVSGVESSAEYPIILQKIKAEPFKEVLEYLYSGRVFFRGNIKELSDLAEQLALPHLQKLCAYHSLFYSSEGSCFKIVPIPAFKKAEKTLVDGFKVSEIRIDPERLLDIYLGDEFRDYISEKGAEGSSKTSDKLQDYVVSLAKKILDAVKSSLSANEMSAFIGFEPDEQLFAETKRVYPLLAAMRNELFSGFFGLHFNSEVFCTYPQEECLFVSWDPEQDKDLRSLLGVPYAQEAYDGERQRNRQRQLGHHTDVVFEVGGKSFAAHKTILAQNPYFYKLFENSEDIINIVGVRPEIFEAFLEYSYSKEISFLNRSVDDLIELAQLAYNMGSPSLENICHFRLIWSLNDATFQSILSYAERIGNRLLVRACDIFHPWRSFMYTDERV